MKIILTKHSSHIRNCLVSPAPSQYATISVARQVQTSGTRHTLPYYFAQEVNTRDLRVPPNSIFYHRLFAFFWKVINYLLVLSFPSEHTPINPLRACFLATLCILPRTSVMVHCELLMNPPRGGVPRLGLPGRVCATASSVPSKGGCLRTDCPSNGGGGSLCGCRRRF